jgi:hypothetical protein
MHIALDKPTLQQHSVRRRFVSRASGTKVDPDTVEVLHEQGVQGCQNVSGSADVVGLVGWACHSINCGERQCDYYVAKVVGIGGYSEINMAGGGVEFGKGGAETISG